MLERLAGLLQSGILQPFPFAVTGMGGRIATVIDILLVALLLTALFRFLRRTRATNILIGFFLVAFGIIIARLFNLAAMNFLLTIFFILLVFATPILFQPELRRGLERLGRRGPFFRNGPSLDKQTVHELVDAARALQARRHGALIVIERNTGLSEYIDTGVSLHADVHSSLLESLFIPGAPLHDGAVIVRGRMIAAAACTLPLADVSSSTRLGTRHRAALGISEASDAVALVLSEEQGALSVAVDGKLHKISSPEHLARVLEQSPHSSP